MTVSAESEVAEAGLPQLPLKSRCLRQSSVAKRLRLETSRGAERTKTRGVKKRLSRYRRKTENAKERERMKKFNAAFENLRQKLPDRELLSEKSASGEKDTKVSSLLQTARFLYWSASKNCIMEVFDLDTNQFESQSDCLLLDSLLCCIVWKVAPISINASSFVNCVII